MSAFDNILPHASLTGKGNAKQVGPERICHFWKKLLNLPKGKRVAVVSVSGGFHFLVPD